MLTILPGLALEEADVLRRAMSGKMRSHKAMEALTKRFFDSCTGKDLSDYVAKELWRQIESFAGYSFCKAHSASFALLSFQVAFLKVHFPAEFMASVLSNGGGFYSAVYIQESKRLGLDVKLPCINESEFYYKGNNKEIRIGLMAIKHLSSSSIKKIVEEREKYGRPACRTGRYVSLTDFIVRTKIGIKETQMLIKCGAMDCFGETRCTLLRLADVYFNKFKMLEEGYNDLFMNESFELEKAVVTKKDFSLEEKCIAEYEAFDYMVTKHPLEFFTKYDEELHLLHSKQMEKYKSEKLK